MKNIKDVEVEFYGDYNRFLSGNFASFAQANEHKKFIQSQGFPNAFVVLYNNGQRMAAPGENPNEIEENNSGNTSEYSLDKLMILIQVGLHRGDLPEDVAKRFSALPDITKQPMPHGVTRYMTGNFKNPSEAVAYKEELIKMGFDNPFLVAYYDNERIDMKKAIEIYQLAK